jgi:hypothetical protein
MQTSHVWRTRVIGVFLLTMTLGTNPVGAQEFSASNRVRKKTYLKTRTDDLSLVSTTSFKNIFTPTSITCPGRSGTCTVRIEVSVVMSPIDSYEGVWLRGGSRRPHRSHTGRTG